MDPFGYAAASAAPLNGYTMATGNGWSPRREEMAMLLRRLRSRFPRTRVFSGRAVEVAIEELATDFGREGFGISIPPTVLRPQVVTVYRPPLPPTARSRPVRRIVPTRIDRSVESGEVIDLTES